MGSSISKRDNTQQTNRLPYLQSDTYTKLLASITNELQKPSQYRTNYIVNHIDTVASNYCNALYYTLNLQHNRIVYIDSVGKTINLPISIISENESQEVKFMKSFMMNTNDVRLQLQKRESDASRRCSPSLSTDNNDVSFSFNDYGELDVIFSAHVIDNGKDKYIYDFERGSPEERCLREMERNLNRDFYANETVKRELTKVNADMREYIKTFGGLVRYNQLKMTRTKVEGYNQTGVIVGVVIGVTVICLIGIYFRADISGLFLALS
jgi:hypothetical protein